MNRVNHENLKKYYAMNSFHFFNFNVIDKEVYMKGKRFDLLGYDRKEFKIIEIKSSEKNKITKKNILEQGVGQWEKFQGFKNVRVMFIGRQPKEEVEKLIYPYRNFITYNRFENNSIFEKVDLSNAYEMVNYFKNDPIFRDIRTAFIIQYLTSCIRNFDRYDIVYEECFHDKIILKFNFGHRYGLETQFYIDHDKSFTSINILYKIYDIYNNMEILRSNILGITIDYLGDIFYVYDDIYNILKYEPVILEKYPHIFKRHILTKFKFINKTI